LAEDEVNGALLNVNDHLEVNFVMFSGPQYSFSEKLELLAVQERYLGIQ
jgi:hypothetical protein